MNSFVALLKREYLEHRGGFLYAPAVLTVLVFGFITLAMIIAPSPDFDFETDMANMTGANLYQVMVLGLFAVWAVYLFISLFFYFADSFSADRRNNALLFWKSMPQSDLKVLTSKALTSLTVFPLLILGFAVVGGVLAYFVNIALGSMVPLIPVAGLLDAIIVLFNTTLVATLFYIVHILWYAPFLAMVAGYSVLFRRWSIPLAILTPGVIVLLERLFAFGRGSGTLPISNYLENRFDSNMVSESFVDQIVINPGLGVWSLVGEMFSNIQWLDMTTGLAFSVGVVYLASEYRRRKIDA